MNNLYKWLLNLNSVVMPLRYLWVFVAFIAVVRLAQKYKPEYVFIRNRWLAMTVGIWCFAFTAFACLTGIFPKMEAFTTEWTFQLALNVARSEEHTSELQSRFDLVCRLLLEKKKQTK